MTIGQPALTIGRTLFALCWVFMHSGAAQSSAVLTTLHNFTGYPIDGAGPRGLAVNDNGVLYGTTPIGGSGPCGLQSREAGCGTVFSLTPPTSAGGQWTEAVLYNFQGGGDGKNPYAAVAVGGGGVLYGTTNLGGTSDFGTVFLLSPPAGGSSEPAGSWSKAALYTFTGSSDGGYPYGGVVIGSGGVLYGTTEAGGTGTCPGGCGTVYSLAPPASTGGAWSQTVLYSFGGVSDGAGPEAGVAVGGDGTLYGTTYLGGTSNAGTVFSLTPPASPNGSWTHAVLHTFPIGQSGPGAVAIGAGGVLYGTTAYGGAEALGTVFSLTPPLSPGGAWTDSILHSFGLSGDGALPEFAGVAIGRGGLLYGTTFRGGTSGSGTVFSMTPPASAGGSWTETVLYDFAGDGQPSYPEAGVVVGNDGVLYGTAGGGTSDLGTVFSLRP